MGLLAAIVPYKYSITERDRIRFKAKKPKIFF